MLCRQKFSFLKVVYVRLFLKTSIVKTNINEHGSCCYKMNPYIVRQLGEVFSVLRLRQKKSCQTACCRLAIIQRYILIFTIHCIFIFFERGKTIFNREGSKLFCNFWIMRLACVNCKCACWCWIINFLLHNISYKTFFPFHLRLAR